MLGPMGKLRVVGSILLLVATTATADAQPARAARQPSKGPIQPGAPVCTVGAPLDDGSCSEWSTLNFVFEDGRGSRFIGAAAHNFAGVGDRATLRGESEAFGTVVVDDDSVDFLHPGDPINPMGTDFALILIDRRRERDVAPAVLRFGGPTGYTSGEDTATGDVIEAYGQGRPDLRNPTGPRSGILVADSERVFSSTVPESGGDSGMPYLHAVTGRALGVNAICLCGGGPGAYPTVGYLLARLAELGHDLTLVTAP
jgi:hypothetical protein